MPVAIRVGLWLTFFVFLNKYRKMQINYIGTYLSWYTFVFKSIAAINYLQVMKNGGNCHAEYP